MQDDVVHSSSKAFCFTGIGIVTPCTCRPSCIDACKLLLGSITLWNCFFFGSHCHIPFLQSVTRVVSYDTLQMSLIFPN